jgi:fatty acid desaturase
MNPVDPAPPRPQGWWAPALERPRVQQLLRRRDLPGIVFLLVWFTLVGATTWALWAVWPTLWTIPVLILHGTVLSFAYAISHEGAHGTAFRSTWLNEWVFYLTSFIFGEEPMYRRYSHGRHHAATWYPGYDSQMPYRNPITLRAYIRETLALQAPFSGIAQMFRHARGLLNEDEREFVPVAKVSRLIWGARLFLLGYVAVFVIAFRWRSLVQDSRAAGWCSSSSTRSTCA